LGEGVKVHAYRNEEAFHSRGNISQAIELQRRAMQSEINGLAEANLKRQRPEQVVQALADKFSIIIPALDEGNIRPEKQGVDVELPNYFGERTRQVQKGTEISIAVPFRGDAEVFKLHASSHTIDYPRGTIEGSTIVFRRHGTNLDPAQVRRDFDQWLSAIKKHLAEMTQELGDFNNTLKTAAEAGIAARAAKLQRDDELLSGLGFNTPPKGP
jgi:hypothetical protein